MQNTSRADVKKIRPYALATIPFLALFAYELATVLPHRPTTPDPTHGYTIAMGSEGRGKPVYVSAGDLFLILAPFFCGFAIVATGSWRAGLGPRFRRG